MFNNQSSVPMIGIVKQLERIADALEELNDKLDANDLGNKIY